MTTKDKLYGIGAFALAGALACLEYLIIISIEAIGSWIADLVGATGAAHLGITLIAYVPALGLIFIVMLAICMSVGMGLAFFKE